MDERTEHHPDDYFLSRVIPAAPPEHKRRLLPFAVRRQLIINEARAKRPDPEDIYGIVPFNDPRIGKRP